MKIKLVKKEPLDGKTWIHYWEDDTCKKSWDISAGLAFRENEAIAHYNLCKLRLESGAPQETILFEEDIIPKS